MGMPIWATILFLFVTALLIFLALMIRFKKAYWLISGFNTMSEEEKLKVDKEKMGKASADSLFIMAGLFFLGNLLFNFNMDIPGVIFMLLIVPVSFCGAAISQKYDYNKTNIEKKRNAIALRVSCVIIMAGLFVLFFFGNKPNAYNISEDTLQISGMYGKTINLSDINTVELSSDLPNDLSKSNGYALNNILKGHFSSDRGSVMLYVDTSKPPFIYLDTDNGIIILNCQTKADTEKLNASLETAILKYKS